MKQKILLFLLVFMPMMANAQVESVFINGLYYVLSTNNNGVVEAYVYKNPDKFSRDIVIPETVNYYGNSYKVTQIWRDAFEECTELRSVVIPNSITIIGNGAFFGCTNLTSITIPNSVIGIGYWAFQNCSGLTDVTLSNSIGGIGQHTFSGCSSLKSIVIPNSVTIIDEYAFSGCSGLTKLTIGNSVKEIREGAFQDCSKSLTSITVESGNPNYDSRDNCNAIISTSSNTLLLGCKNTVIPNTITSIWSEAFLGCIGLANITIPNNIKTINSRAFDGCTSLESVIIEGETKLNSDAFGSFYDSNKNPCPIKTLMINNHTITDVFRNCKTLTTLTLGENVREIANNAFSYTGLTSVTIPSSVENIGGCAFAYCSSLESVTIEGETTFGSSPFGFFSSDTPNPIKTLTINSHTVTDKLRGCKTLTTLILGDNVKEISNNAFYGCSGLTSVSIPSTVEMIGSYAFQGCTSLESVTINGVDTIGGDAFSNCTSLESVTVEGVDTIGSSAFKGCTNLESVTIDGETQMGSDVFGSFRSTTTTTCPIKKLNINSEVILGTFKECKTLTNLVLGNKVKEISDWAFEGCSGLTSVNIPNSLINIGVEAFRNCSALTSINLPESIISIGRSAFQGCSGLTSITIPNSVTSLNGTFYRCSGLKTVTIPKSVTSITDMAFEQCSGVDNVYCYANPQDFIWDSSSSDFKRGTLFHVTDVNEWKSKFPYALVTFVGDLRPEKVVTNIIVRNNEQEYWSSFYDSMENYIAADGVKVYMVNVTDNQLSLIEVPDRIINKGQGVVLKSTTGDVVLTCSETESTADYSQNCLMGTDVEITNPGNAYVLNSKTSGLGFYKLSAIGKIGANKAYLVYSSTDARNFMAFDGEDTTGIKNTITPKGDKDVYNLNGLRVSRPAKGIYVIDGKKIMIK